MSEVACGTSLPSPDSARSALYRSLSGDRAAQLKLVEFQKVDGQTREVMGVKAYVLDFTATFEVGEDALYSVDDSGIQVTAPSPTLSRGSEFTWAAFFNSVVAQRSMVYKGDRLMLAGSVSYELKESGWVPSRPSFKVRVDSKLRAEGHGPSGAEKAAASPAAREYGSGNSAYQRQDYRQAVSFYQAALKRDPDLGYAYFFLGSSLNNLYRPEQRGDPVNDALLVGAAENYQRVIDVLGKSADEADKKLVSLAMESLVAAFAPDRLNDRARATALLKKLIELQPKEPSNYAVLAKAYEDAGLYNDAEKVLLMSKEANPSDSSVYLMLAGFYNRRGRFDKTIESLNQRATTEPNNPEAFQTIAGYYWDETRGNASLTVVQKKEFIGKGLEAVNKALSLKADYVEALTFKGLLLRLQADIEEDATKRAAIQNEAAALMDRANKLRR